jgi:hypothetical protein
MSHGTYWERNDRERLRHRVRRNITHINEQQFDECYNLLDPKLLSSQTAGSNDFLVSLKTFIEVYGRINVWHTKLYGTWDSRKMNGDKRPFAYAYVVWFDAQRRFHLFRQRWVRDGDLWYSRVIGLVAYDDDRGPASMRSLAE